jgi:predicted Fe-Mo cluster-binding NifX family protein
MWEGLKDCSVIISHGMGRRAWQDLGAMGVEIIVTDETDVERALELYLTGDLQDKSETLIRC